MKLRLLLLILTIPISGCGQNLVVLEEVEGKTEEMVEELIPR